MAEDTFGKRLKKLRIKRGMKRSYLAGRTNINPAYLKELEDDEIAPILDIAERLAKILDATVGYLLYSEDTILRQSLQNLELYIQEEAINGEEAKLLRSKVERKITRSAQPMNRLDFDGVRKHHISDQIIDGICYRCHHGVTSETGCICPNCGALWDAPDN